jgi:hypothetical protein
MLNVYSQEVENVNAKDIFYMQLFLDKSMKKNASVLKNDSLYRGYRGYMDFDLVCLETKNIEEEFQFYSLKWNIYMDDGRIRFINKNNMDIESDKMEFYDFSGSATTEYVLCINTKTGRSYRIYGFNGNDFFSLLRDYNEIMNKRGRFSDKDFLKECWVDGIDFKCLYKALKDSKRDGYSRYPCLLRVSDPIVIGD